MKTRRLKLSEVNESGEQTLVSKFQGSLGRPTKVASTKKPLISVPKHLKRKK
jgi:hypothetical protein